MIIELFLQFLINALGFIFALAPSVDKLPNIAGYDIDTVLATNVGIFWRFAQVFWPLQILIQGFVFLMGYYLIKLVFKVILGSRLPSLSH